MRTAWDIIVDSESGYNNPNVITGDEDGLGKIIANARMHAMIGLLAKIGLEHPKEAYEFMQLIPAELLYKIARELSK